MQFRFFTNILAVTALFAFAQAAVAEVYVCIDKNGRRLTSDRPIAECLDRPQRVLHPNGVEQTLMPKKTMAERMAAEAEVKAQARKRAQEIEAIRADRILRARFPDEESLDQHRAYTIYQIERRWKATLDEQAGLESRRKVLTERARARRLEGKPAEFAETKEAAEIEKRSDQIRLQVEKARDEISAANKKIDVDLKRLREMWALEKEIKRIQAGGSISTPAATLAP